MTTTAEFYTVSLSSIAFTVPCRYERLQCTSCGAFSAVAVARDRKQSNNKDHRLVAIKKLARPFQDCERARRTFRELHLLASLCHPNLISLLGAFSPQMQQLHNVNDDAEGGDEGAGRSSTAAAAQLLQDVYLVMPHMECDLATLLAQRGRLKCSQALKIAHGLLSGLRYLHAAGVLHRDLKPANVALSRDGCLKILDFGLARSAAAAAEGGDGQESLTGYVCTRNYRSPELLLSCPYGRPADLWSVGCILAEALLGRVLFPALNAGHLVHEICRLLGKPEGSALAWAPVEAARFIAEMDLQQPATFESTFGQLRLQSRGQHTCDLLHRLLTFDPALRLSAEAALAHPAMAGHQKAAAAAAPIATVVDSEFETARLDTGEWRRLVWEKLRGMAATSC